LCLAPGDTLYIRGGTYQGNINNIPSGKSWSAPVTLAAYPGETVTVRRIEPAGPYVVIDGLIVDADPTLGTVGILIQGAQYIRIKNTEVKNAIDQGILGGDYSEFINLHVHHNGIKPDGTVTCFAFKEGYGRGYCHGLYTGGNNNLIDGGRWHNNEAYGIHIYKASGTGPSNNIVRNALVYNNATTGIGVVYGVNNRVYNNIVYGNTQGIWVVTTDGQFYNNTVYNNRAVGISVGYPRNIISNNIIFANGSGLGVYPHHGPVSGVIIKNNLAAKNGQNFGDSTGGGVTSQGNLFGDAYDPKFFNLSALDFRLQSGSPAIDAGIAVPEVLTDFAGTPRPTGRAYDIGAYEQ
jgi:parallel beta-helix repeat protein